ncbi:winged helix DNA-binding domain-containing protein [Kineosporia sp. R_H_3]|uniref:winged helix DNA-binding domain-containing protein n=1 Tax=Kineosporia sp. R_H_3 TaxID=1961848 RepID=UPI000B4C1645|nr:winged helix DNA-binding domain-containing protein [Kineosporia sp. R_H_3]
MSRMTWCQVTGRRMLRQGLVTPLETGAAGIVRAMCGAQAQVPSAAELSVALRGAGLTTSGVRHALHRDRVLVRTFGPRGTVHLFAAEDLLLWVRAFEEVYPVAPAAGSVLDERQSDAVVDAVDDALRAGQDAGALTLDELSDAVVARAGAWAGDLVLPAFGGFWPRWRQALVVAAGRGVLCYGPSRGRATTFVSPRRWLPRFDPAGIAPSGAGPLVRRYLEAYGPARPEDLARWLAVTPARAARWFAELDLEPVEVEGVRAWPAWQLPGAPESDVLPEGVRLLPYFDAYVIAAAPRDLLHPGRAADRALTRGQAGTRPVVLVDGVVRGIWHARTTRATTHLTVEVWQRLSARRRRDLTDEVHRVGDLTGTRATLELGEVKAGPHA